MTSNKSYGMVQLWHRGESRSSVSGAFFSFSTFDRHDVPEPSKNSSEPQRVVFSGDLDLSIIRYFMRPEFIDTHKKRVFPGTAVVLQFEIKSRNPAIIMNLLNVLALLHFIAIWLGVYSLLDTNSTPNQRYNLRGISASPQRNSLILRSPFIHRRALPNAPDAYTPEGEICPTTSPTVRNGSTISTNETAWLGRRRNMTVDAMIDFLGRLDLGSLNASSYIEKNSANASALPNIGIAASGGGYRALMNGGGGLQAFDSRTVNSSLPGHLGGVLQSATYLSGLSGGSWLVGSIYINNFTDVTSLRDSGTVWLFQDSIFVGPKDSATFAIRTSDYYSQMQDAVTGKTDAGYNTSITDYW